MGSHAAHLRLSDVRVGDEIPPLAHDVTATTVILGALATRDWRPMHHDRDFAQQRNGHRRAISSAPSSSTSTFSRPQLLRTMPTSVGTS